MQIKSAEFMRGVIGSTDFLVEDTRPQIAFIGRSNVGKSSVINKLVQRKSLVHTSSKPGKTLQINFFLINNIFYFVDLPGYGYAKRSQKHREKIRRMILWYLTSGEARPLVLVLIVDAKAGIRDFDREMLSLAYEEGYHVILVMNKVDKLNQKNLAAQKKALEKEDMLIRCDYDIIFHSAKTGRGSVDLLNAIEKVL